MSSPITITNEEILYQLKLSLKLPEIIEGIVTRKIVKDTAAEAEIEIPIEELQEAADQFRLTNQLSDAKKTWKWLDKQGLSLEDFEEMIYLSVLSDKLAHHLFANQVESYFLEHQLDYTGVVLYEVVLDDEDLAMELYYAIQEGEVSFYEVAHQYVKDIELRRKGGYKGIVYRKDLKPEVSAAVFAANPPQVLKPIVSSTKLNLVLVEEIVQPQLDERLRSQIRSHLFLDWLKKSVKSTEVSKFA